MRSVLPSFKRRPLLTVGAAIAVVAGVGLPVATLAGTAAAGTGSSATAYTPSTPTLATITNGTSAAPWNLQQGDPASASYASQAPGTLLPTYTPGGATTGTGAAAEPNVAVYPGATSGTDGNSPYPSGTVGTPGPLAGYCGTGSATTAANGSPVRQPAGTTLPLAPAYFPHITRNADGSLSGLFDYRPKDADEAIVAATSTDNGKTWTYQGEALEQNPGYCPAADINDDGEGHPNVLTVGGVSRLYTLQRPAGDNTGVGMLVHTLTSTTANPLAGLPASESVGIDADAFATSAVAVPATGGTPVSIPLNQTGTANSPEQLVAGQFVDLTVTPKPTASSVITCTAVTSTALTGCTTSSPGGLNVSTSDLVEQVIGTASASAVVPPGPNKTSGDGGLSSLGITFVDQLTAAILNANAPNRLYLDGVAVYCSQSNANPTSKIEDCTTGPGGNSLSVTTGDPLTSDPIIPATATPTTGLVSPDGIVGVLPTYPGVPTGATAIAYTEKILNYYVAGTTTNSGSTTFGSTIAFLPSPNFSADMPSTISPASPVVVSVGDSTKTSIISVTCTGLTTGPTDTLTGCSVPSADTGDKYSGTSLIGAPGATTVSGTTLGFLGEGSTTSTAKLFKNNEDLTVLRVAYTTDGVTFSSAGLANNGIISGASNGASNYQDINNPSSTTSPSNLNAYATPGTADATEMRFVGSAGTIITNPDGSYGMFLSGAWAADGDSDAFNQIYYTTSTDGEHWSVPVSVVSTDYTFAASVAQDAALAQGNDQPLGISAYYSGRAYGPSVVQNPDGTLTMVFAGYRMPKPISSAGTVLGTNSSAPYTVGATDPALYRNILVETLTSATSPAVSTTTSVSPSTATPVVGQQVTYTATVAPVAPGTGTPTGSVTFTGSAGPLCTTNLNLATSDQAICTTTYNAVGSDSVTASYAGDSNYAGSAASPTVISIGADSTTTTLAADPTDPVVGQSVTYTATVTVQSPGSGTPTGMVTFADAAGTLCSTSLDEQNPDQATCSTAYTSAQGDAVTASYGGDGNDQASASQPYDESVSAAATQTTLDVVTASPVVGQSVTFTATVTPVTPGAGVPTGTVIIAGDAGTLCTATLDATDPDQATCAASYPAVGSDSVTASYVTDGNFNASTSSAEPVSIAAADTQVDLSAQPSSPIVGQQVTYTATVSALAPGAGTPTGSVTFTDGSSTVCTSPLNGADPDQASCTTTYATAQSHQITASYAGDGNFNGAVSGTLSESINPVPTTTGLVLSPTNPVVGQIVTLTATVAPAATGGSAPTGDVTFSSAEFGTLCVNPLVDGKATCTTSYPAVMQDSLSASYEGDDSNGSSSDSKPITVSMASTTTALQVSPTSLVTGQSATLTAKVSVSGPGAGTATGSVTFSDANGTLCSAPLNGTGTASCDTSAAAPGSENITATYGGDSNFITSASAATKVTITAASTTSMLGADTQSSVNGQVVTYTDTVAVNAPGAGVPTGKVTFLNKSKVLCVVTLNDLTPDQAQCEVASGKVGTLNVTASYAGSFGYTASTSNAVTETVTAAQTQTVVSADPSSSVTGQALTIAAQVSAVAPSSGTPTGALQFAVETAQGAAVKCTGSTALSKGIAHCTLPLSVLTPANSPLSITASYAGSTSFQPSSDATRAHIGIDGSAVSVKSSANPAPSGNKVTLTATVTAQKPGAGVPQGNVTFSFAPSGVACQGSDIVPLTAKGTAACVLAKGVLTSAVNVTASYGGSVAYTASSGMLDQQVKAQKAALPGSFLTLVRMRNA